MIAVSSGPVITNTSSFTFYQFTVRSADAHQFTRHGRVCRLSDTGRGCQCRLHRGQRIPLQLRRQYAFCHQEKFRLRRVGLIVVTPFREMGLFTPQGADNDTPDRNHRLCDCAEYWRTSGQLLFPPRSHSGRYAYADPQRSRSAIGVPATASPTSAPSLRAAATWTDWTCECLPQTCIATHLTGTTTLWTAHTNKVNSSGIASSGEPRCGALVRNSKPRRNPYRSSRLVRCSIPPPAVRFISCAGRLLHPGQGAMALGATATGAASPTKVAVSGRLITDPAGATQAQTLISPFDRNLQWRRQSRTLGRLLLHDGRPAG